MHMFNTRMFFKNGTLNKWFYTLNDNFCHLVQMKTSKILNLSKEKTAADPNDLAALARLLFEDK